MRMHDGRGARRSVLAIVTEVDEYQRCILRAAQQVLAVRGMPLIAHCDGPFERGASSRLLVDLLQTSRPAGILCIDALEEEDQYELLAMLSDVATPTVHVGTEGGPGAAWVRGDNPSGMRELMSHVLDERGARSLVLLRGKEYHPDSIAREAVFREELQRRGIPIDEELIVQGRFEPEVAADAMYTLLAKRRDFDAVIALNDQMALSAVSTLMAAGLRVPQDVAVTGFDDDDAAQSWPGLTTVDQGLATQGTRAAELLLGLIDGSQQPAGVVVPSRLVVRGSTAPTGRAVMSLEEAEGMARAQRERLAAQDGILAMSHALDYCWTVDDIVAVLDTHLPRLGVRRGFLALYDRVGGDDRQFASRADPARARLMLAHRDGQRIAVPADLFDSWRLLPERFTSELESGLLLLQPLAVLDRPFGFILFEQTGGSDRLTELMRIDLSRALDGVLTTQETRTHAAMLERVVARRTQELQSEVMTRRRAERELQRANEELHRSAMLDGLTQIANRAAFGSHLAEHWQVQSGSASRLAMLMVDVDGFKPYNDHYGHVLGDEALRVVASCLRRAVWGADDLACRYGGEEFAVVLPRSGVEGAVAVAQRFQELLQESAIEHVASPVGVGVLTASIGIAVALPAEGVDPQSLVEAADEAMYRAKTLGRNRIQIADDTPRRPAPAGVGGVV